MDIKEAKEITKESLKSARKYEARYSKTGKENDSEYFAFIDSILDKIEQGKMVEQPVKSHTFIFWVDEDGRIHSKDKYLTSIWQDGRLVHLIYNGENPYKYWIVFKFYLSREDAEKADI